MVTPRTGNPVGAPRKPTALKVLHGDHKKNPQRINRNEPIPAVLSEPPAMTRTARAWWDRLAPDMVRKGVLTEWDAPAFAEFCESIGIMQAARVNAMREVAGQWTYIQGQPAPTTVYQRTVVTFLAFCGRFGMTPADRTRLQTPVEGGGHGAKADLLSG